MSEIPATHPKDVEVEIDMFRLLQIFLKHAWLIITVTIACAVTAYLISACLIPPTYRSSFTAYVNNRVSASESGGTTTSDLNASISLTYLYQDIIVSRSVLTDAAQRCGISSTYDKLLDKVTTTVSESSGLITVYVTDTDPVLAMQYASTIAEVAPGHVERIRDGSSMRILDEPVLPENKHEPNILISTFVGAMVGFILCSAIVITVDLVNDVVNSADELEQRYHVVVIGTIPDISAMENNSANSDKIYGKVDVQK